MGIFKNKPVKEEKKQDKVLEDLVKPNLPAFLPHEKPIDDIMSFCARVSALKECISDANLSIKDMNEKKERLNKSEFRIETNSFGTYCLYHDTSNYKSEEFNKKVRDELNKIYDSNILKNQELIHTCEDELEWLSLKLNGIDNRFKTGAYMIDPTKNHA